ncbi:SRPBCC family protein [Nakamurella lactea]|uniref:SRPBCC family protein n=1 Tax=Nakamurella lactea TaxID=459515 RepID=UPI001B7FB0AB|nr:carbon monoxide dehydrogenase subunit G [Nakamurella lactea]
MLHAPPDRVWQAINDPAVLAGVIPGCDQLTEIGDGHFGMTVTLGVAAIKGSYTGEVRLYDKVPPASAGATASLTMRANGAGGPGTIDTTVAVKLTDLGDGTTQLDYDADAVVGGMVGGVGQRVLTSVAKKTAGLFFSAIDDVLTGKKPAGKAPAAAEPLVVAGAVGGEVGPGPGQPDSYLPGHVGPLSLAARVQTLPLLGAALFGAASMLAGVLVGARIARRR